MECMHKNMQRSNFQIFEDFVSRNGLARKQKIKVMIYIFNKSLSFKRTIQIEVATCCNVATLLGAVR